ncbi:hypothetical protein FRC08_005958 [Ceratobasidium sp. 394]|nr:hypothetical protein FRC08_005958 [Ceratobasidium sp. 394]
MTDLVDVDQMEAASLPAPSTSRTPAPRLAHTASARNPAATPDPQTPKPPRRMTRSRAAATASASGSHIPPVPTARRPLPRATSVAAKREPSSSLTPPPDITAHDNNFGLGAQGRSRNSRDSSESRRTGGNDAGDRHSPSLATGLSSHTGPTVGVSRSTAQNYPSAVDRASPTLAASVPLPVPAARATTPTTDDRPATPSAQRAPPLPSNVPQKRKAPTPDSEGEEGRPLLSEYMCPICFSPPKSAIVTPCGHILCGACLHGATIARAANTQPLCPVCRTPIPSLRFAMPESRLRPGAVPGGPGTNTAGAGARRPRRRRVPPASRTLANGIAFPTPGEEMLESDQTLDGNVSEGGTIDVDGEESDGGMEDAARSGVIGLELLTMANL